MNNLFPTVDDLTRRINAKLALPGNVNPTTLLLTSPITVTSKADFSVDRALKDVTTSSIEAYRYYAEGINLHERGREQEAVPLFEKAIVRGSPASRHDVPADVQPAREHRHFLPRATMRRRRNDSSTSSTQASTVRKTRWNSSAACTTSDRSTTARATATGRARSPGDSWSTGAAVTWIASASPTRARDSSNESRISVIYALP